jgi:glyoxylase-like metal-dependent hydrolase (beta-lactamase superfamily II)
MNKLQSSAKIRSAVLLVTLAAHSGSSLRAERDYSETEVTITPLRGSLYALAGAGGRQIASIGPDGVLLVDSSWAEMVPKVRSALQRLGGEHIDFVVNSHWHPDHTDGNRGWAETAEIIAHESVRRRHSDPEKLPEWARQWALPANALPHITFSASHSLSFNGEEILLRRLPLCHTEGDISVYFSDSHVLHLGDGFLAPRAFPPLNPEEQECGVAELLRSLDRLLEGLPGDTLIVTGHGGIASRADLVELRDVVAASLELVRQGRAAGMRLVEIQSQELPERFKNWGKEQAPLEEWLALVYLGETRREKRPAAAL